MSAPAPPTIPPRPVKQQAVAQGVSKLPDIPPRPQNRRVDRSISPSHYPRSPLNDPYVPSRPKDLTSSMRPPSVHHLPTPGEEGMEYANIQYSSDPPASALAQDAAAQKRTIAEDLHLHAPKPSLPTSTATAQVQGVTRTDSAQATSQGLRRPSNDDLTPTRTRSRQSFSRPDSTQADERRRSVVPEEHGPAELGLRVPINPLLGDVQAPTPQGLSPQATGESGRRHNRRKSGLEDFLPPDSYGLHGHGMIANNKFERDWYAKHPDQLEHEEGHGHGVYEGIGSGRGSYALSSDELNKIVRDTASRGAGFGTQKSINSFPDEQIGYMASETYQRSQQNTPLPEPLSRLNTRSSQPSMESPLRRTSFPAEDAPPAEIRRNRLSTHGTDKAVTDDETHHIDQPDRRYNKITGGQEQINETSGGSPYITTGHDQDGNEHRVPILAEDEVAKSVGADFMQPAVSPKFERRGSQQHDDHNGGALTPTSRPASRPGSIYQLHSASHSLSRFLSHQDDRDHMHTPLEDVAEYEPLFEESEERKALTTAERFKRRPDALQRRFPSQDIWEDTPSSAMHMAEVSTPDLPSQNDSSKSELRASSTFESPEAEHARKGEVPEEDKHNLAPLEERLAKSRFAPHLRDDMPTKARPAIAHRFPSRDIWEDTPDSNYLTTTVSTPEVEPESSPLESKPPVPERPAKSRLGEGASSNQVEPSVPPQLPVRPQKRTQQVSPTDARPTDTSLLSKQISPPSLPDRPKPQVPPRPGKKAADEDLTRVTSAGSTESTDTQVAAKAKPQVPARPAGGNFASLRGNFMNDLNKKLGLGPPKEKEPEPEIEAKPLEDARKGRARGPQRRAPAKAAADTKSTASFTMFAPRGLWRIDDHDELSTISETQEETNVKEESMIDAEPGSTTEVDYAAQVPVPTTKAEDDLAGRPIDAPKQLASGLATNTAGEPADPVPEGDNENFEGELTRKTTASTLDGEPIDRENSRETTHVLPASQQTTASDSDVPAKIQRVPTNEPEVKAADESIKVRNEQVSAPAPEPANTHSVTGKHDLLNKTTTPISGSVNRQVDVEPASEGPTEPMNEDDVDYGKLEEMTALADGKQTAVEDPQASFSSRKIVD
ncbi:hypothetical protein LTS08_000866 [Lithohypha guttulata]|uniref:uncharacterized protein n=1 Tax=Lithohypha guttulata TaxID=1690604 RepID=UPI002DE0C10D|nr:hypothetical protein LTR51_006520 [Lithohypha guttulata]KAK5106744.1 hypothetical protein LTS08_000866 [Lithohypha guttulata]